MSSLPQIVFNYPSSEDSQSPPEKQAKKESWEKRVEKLETGELSDCRIIVGGRTIPTHKFVLSEFPYFAKKFGIQSNFKVDERDQINIPDYEYAIVYEMIKYMYSFKVNISTENVQRLLMISDEYEVARLFEKAQQFIVERIETENVIDCLILTEHITAAKLLKSTSIDYILDHYFELQATESWKKLTLNLVLEILHHDKLNQRITDINAENADELLDLAKKRHVKKLTEAVQKFKNRV